MLSISRLPNKIENERVVKVVRKNWFILFGKVFFFALLAVLPLVFFYFLVLSDSYIMAGRLTYPLIVLGASAYYLFLWLFLIFSFIDFYLDVWVITTERIIDIAQQGFFSRVISEHKLSRIQDVTSEVHGFFPTILKFGDLHVQTAGVKQRFIFEAIPHPESVRQTIIHLMEMKKCEEKPKDKFEEQA